MKKMTSLVCAIVMIFTLLPIISANTKTPLYTRSTYMAKTDLWGPFSNDGVLENRPTHSKVDGEGGMESDVLINGGLTEGGFIFSLNGGNFATGTHGPNKEYTGLIDASEMVIRYKSLKSVRISFVVEFRKGGTRTYTSKELTLPATNGEFADKVYQLSEFENANMGKRIYCMNGVYDTTFNPVVELKLTNILPGNTLQFSKLDFNWYQEDMVSEIAIEDYKSDYMQFVDAFDYSQGVVKIKRGGGTEFVDELPLDDPRVSITGFSNTTLKDPLTLTATALNKKVTFNVKVKTFVLPTLTDIVINFPKTEYWEKETFDIKTGTITANFSDKPSQTIPLTDSNVRFSGFDSSSPIMNQKLTVSYGGQSTTYNVNINKFEFTGNMSVLNPKRLYRIGDDFDWHTGTIVPENGPSGKLFSVYSKVSGFDSSSPTTNQVITVEYGGLIAQYSIDIIEDELPIKYILEPDMSSSSQPACWQWGGLTLKVSNGKSEDGTKPAVYASGDGTHGGGGAMVFLDSKNGGGEVTMPDGTVLDGLKGLDAVQFRYINTFDPTYNDGEGVNHYAQYAPSLQFKVEYQGGTGTSSSSKSYKIPVTTGQPNNWSTLTVPISAFDGTDKSYETAPSINWLYDGMKSKYLLPNYAPSVQLRFNGKVMHGHEFAIEAIRFLWLEDQPVESIELRNMKTSYVTGEVFDNNIGLINITYKDGTERTVSVKDTNPILSGFDSAISTASQTVTLKYAGVSASYDISITEDTKGKLTISQEPFENLVETQIDNFDGQDGVCAKLRLENLASISIPSTAAVFLAVYNNDKLIRISSFEIPLDIEPGIQHVTSSILAKNLENATKVKIVGYADIGNMVQLFEEPLEIVR